MTQETVDMDTPNVTAKSMKKRDSSIDLMAHEEFINPVIKRRRKDNTVPDVKFEADLTKPEGLVTIINEKD